MATEELIVLLDAKTQKLDAKLRKTERRLDELDGTVKKTDKSFGKFSNAAGVAVGVSLKLAAAALAVTAAITAMTLSAASNRRELEILSRQARTSTDDFQALAFATAQYGIDAEKIADASKDITDRIGEFAAAGTGVFQDYADTMKLGKDAAREAAREFEGLGSQEILGTMVSRMEDANISGDKMLFVMESLANDASKLIPLFANNSEELKKLKERFNDVNESLQITNTQAEALKGVSETFQLLQKSSANAATAISATLAPVMDDFFNDIIAIVPDATQTIIDFINSFLEAENISSVAGVNKEIESSILAVTEAEKELEKVRDAGGVKIGRAGSASKILQNNAEAILEQERKRLTELEAQLEVLKAQEKKLEDVNRLTGGEIGGETGEDIQDGGLDVATGTGDEIAAIEDRFKLEETLLAEKLERELILIGDDYSLRLELLDEFNDNVKELQDKRDSVDEKRRFKENRRELFAEKRKLKDKADLLSSYSNAASIINAAFLNDNKAIGAAMIVADTAAGVMRAFATSSTIYEAYGHAAVVVATGLAQLSNLQSATPGGGSVGGGATGEGGRGSQVQQDFTPETNITSLEFTDQSDSGSTQQRITFDTETGDDLIDAFANALNKGISEGRFA